VPQKCSLCIHGERKEIDAALVSGTSYRNIAERFGTSLAAIFRHKSHTAQAIAKATEKRDLNLGDSILSRLEKLYERGEKILDDAERGGDGRLALASIREVRETLGGIFALANKAAAAGGAGGPVFQVAVVYGATESQDAVVDGEIMDERRES